MGVVLGAVFGGQTLPGSRFLGVAVGTVLGCFFEVFNGVVPKGLRGEMEAR